jgi:hypothetical protein
MQAKVIKTGEVVEVYKTTTGWVSETLNKIRFFEGAELDFDYREWEIFRREMAKEALCVMISGGYGSGREKEQASLAVRYADELIKSLKEESK